MFISTKEKQRIDELLDRARGQILTLEERISILEHKLEKLESRPVKVKKPMTEEQKAKNRDYQRAYQARRKAQKLTEGNTNVSA